MPSINFLNNKKENERKEKKSSGKQKHKIAWSETEKTKSAKPNRSSSSSTKRKHGKWFSFFNKEKDIDAQVKDEIIDRQSVAKIKSSRKDILKSIKEEKIIKKVDKKEDNLIKNDKFIFLDWLKNKFGKREKSSVDSPAHSEENQKLSKKYKQVFKNAENVEKIIKDSSKKEAIQVSPPPIPPTKPDKNSSLLLNKEKKSVLINEKVEKKKFKFSFRKNKPEQVKIKNGGKENKLILDEKKISPPAVSPPVKKEAQNIKDKKWESANILETNLIKEEIAAFFDWKKGIIKLVIFTSFSLSLVIGGYKGVIIWSGNKKHEAIDYNYKISNINKKIEPLEEYVKEILIFQKKLKLVVKLLDQHIYWTNFFRFLEDNTTPEVYYTSSFGGDTSGKYSLSAKTKSFRGVLDQVNAMRLNENVIHVNVSGGNVSESEEGEKSVDFTLDFSLKPTIFFK